MLSRYQKNKNLFDDVLILESRRHFLIHEGKRGDNRRY